MIGGPIFFVATFEVFESFFGWPSNTRYFVVVEKANSAQQLRPSGGRLGHTCPPTRPIHPRLGRGRRQNGERGHILWPPAIHVHSCFFVIAAHAMLGRCVGWTRTCRRLYIRLNVGSPAQTGKLPCQEGKATRLVPILRA